MFIVIQQRFGSGDASAIHDGRRLVALTTMICAIQASIGGRDEAVLPLVEQVNAALAFLLRKPVDFKIDPATVVLAGDSAGAHISSQVALITTDPAYANAVGIPPKLKADQISAMLLLSGAYDPSAVNFEGNFGWFLKTALWAYSGVKNFREDERFRLMSVPRYVTKAFPPSFISSGNGDPLARQAVVLAQKLGELGVHVDTLFFPPDRAPALPHEYQFNLDDPAGREALNRMLAFLDSIRGRAANPGSPDPTTAVAK